MTKVLFHTAPYCGPCKVLKPKVVAMCSQYGAEYVEVDISKEPGKSEGYKYGIFATPEVVILRGSEKIAQIEAANIEFELPKALGFATESPKNNNSMDCEKDEVLVDDGQYEKCVPKGSNNNGSDGKPKKSGWDKVTDIFDFILKGGKTYSDIKNGNSRPRNFDPNDMNGDGNNGNYNDYSNGQKPDNSNTWLIGGGVLLVVIVIFVMINMNKRTAAPVVVAK
jgi:thiol-disulfide isomerase/thioredoxin